MAGGLDIFCYFPWYVRVWVPRIMPTIKDVVNVVDKVDDQNTTGSNVQNCVSIFLFKEVVHHVI